MRYISICNMKSLWLSLWAGQQIKEKYQIGCHLKTYIGDNMYIGKPNMKFLCLTLWQGKVCTDDDDDANNDANANDNREGMIV